MIAKFIGGIFFALLLVSAVHADVFDEMPVRTWTAVSLNKMNSLGVAPSPPVQFANGTVAGGQGAVMAYSGGFFDTKRNRLVVMGGGHGDYAGNELYCFSIATRLWTRCWGPTPNSQIQTTSGGSANEAYLDGHPASRHTYLGILYLPNVDKYFINGGSLAGGAGDMSAQTWVLDPNTSIWTQKAAVTSCYPGSATPGGAYDPIRAKVYVHRYTTLCEYDVVANTWTVRGGDGAGFGADNSTGVFDPRQRAFCLIGVSVTRCYDMTRTDNAIPLTTRTTTGDKTCENSAKPGVDYDSISMQIVCWPGTGAAVYTLDLATGVWTKINPASGNTITPTNAANWDGANGHTFGRFRYVPSKHVFLLINAVTEDVYAYKLADPLPAGQWKELKVANTFPIGLSAALKHTTCAFNPRDKKSYCVGGDYNGGSYIQQILSLDVPVRLAGGTNRMSGWALAFPAGTTVNSTPSGLFKCPSPAAMQPKAPDFNGLLWDESLGEFWFMPGTQVPSPEGCVGQTADGVQNPLYKYRRVMRFNPVTAAYTDIGDATPSPGSEPWWSVFDPVSNRIIQPTSNSELQVYNTSTNTWTGRCMTTNALGQNITAFNRSYYGVDRVGRWVYGVDTDHWRLHRFSLDLPSGAGGCVPMEDLGPVPDATQENQTKLAWNPHARVLIVGNNAASVLNAPGTVSISGSTVTGVGTSFLSQVVVGFVVRVKVGFDYTTCKVGSVNSNTSITCSAVTYDAGPPSGQPYHIITTPKIYAYNPATATWETLPAVSDTGFVVGGNAWTYDETNNVLAIFGFSDFTNMPSAASFESIFFYRYGSAASEPTTPVPNIPTNLVVK